MCVYMVSVLTRSLPPVKVDETEWGQVYGVVGPGGQ